MKLATSVFALFFTVNVSNLFSQVDWKPIGPGGGSDLKSIAIQPNNPNVVYIGGDIEGIFKTTNGGETWKNINNNLSGGHYPPDIYYIQEIVFDLTDLTYQTLYICTAIGLFKTLNGGQSWIQIFPMNISSEDDFIPVSYLAIDPSNSEILYLGSGFAWSNSDGKGKIYKSTNRGISWDTLVVTSSNAIIHGIFVDPNSSLSNRTIYVSSSSGMFKSTNGGNSWNSINNGLPHTLCRRLFGKYFGSELILYVSLISTGIKGDPNSFKGGIYKSTNGGTNWTNINGDLPKYQVQDSLFYFYWKFIVHPSDPNTILIGTTRGWPAEEEAAYEEMGIYKTTDGGSAWELISNNVNNDWMAPPFYYESNAFILELAPSNPNVIYWGLVWMKKSTDGGDTWKQINSISVGSAWKTNGLELMVVDGIAFDPTNSNRIYVGYDDFGIFRSDDAGNSFIPVQATQGTFGYNYDAAKDILIDPSNGDVYQSRYEGLKFALENGFQVGQIWRSTDAGANWTKISNGLPNGTPKLIGDFNSGSPGNRTLYCAIYNHGIYKTTNSGTNWTAINSGLGTDSGKVWQIAVHPNNSNILYAGLLKLGAGGEIYKSTNAGGNWTKLISAPNEVILSIKIDKNNGYVYVSATNYFEYTFSGGLYRSTDEGQTWNKIFNQPRIVDVEIHPTNSNLIFAASQSWYQWNTSINSGVFVSTNGGVDWQNITNNLGHTHIRLMKLNPHNPNQVFVGTGGGGLWYGNYTSTSVGQEVNGVLDYKLYQNYPNPFNSTTMLEFALPREALVTLKVYNMLGQEVTTLVNEKKLAGTHLVQFDASHLPTGVYFYKIVAGGYVQAKKMVLLK